jgi:hypothetical protein
LDYDDTVVVEVVSGPSQYGESVGRREMLNDVPEEQAVCSDVS